MKVDIQGRVKMDTFTFMLSWISIFSYPGVDSSSPDVQKHLDMGRKLLESRQFSDALTQFHEAVELDPDNFQTYFKRALVFLALGKYNQALKDFDMAIELKPDFTSAHLQRASLLLKQGNLDTAHIDFEHVLRHDTDNAEALQGYQSVDEAWKLKEELKYYTEVNDCNMVVDLLTKLIEVSPWDPALRHQRSDCYLTLGESSYAVNDLRFTTRLVMDDTDGYYRLSSLQYQLGELEEALKEIRECLKLDPEHKLCFPLYKTLKKLDKSYQGATKAGESEQYGECVADVKKALKVDSKLPNQIEFKLRHKLCWCHLKGGEGSLAVDHCSKAIHIVEDPDVLCDRAEAYLLDDLFEQAIHDYKRVIEINGDHRRGTEGLSRAQKLQKQSKKRDYYKILGVNRNAKKGEIVKAYRKLAQKWHPDNFHGEEQKSAQAKFIDIAAAKEVLTDPEKRAKFDNGEDPLDPESQQGGHHHGGQGFPFFFQNSAHFRRPIFERPQPRPRSCGCNRNG